MPWHRVNLKPRYSHSHRTQFTKRSPFLFSSGRRPLKRAPPDPLPRVMIPSFHSGGWRGRRTLKRVPADAEEVTSTLPPCAVTIMRTMYRPSPMLP